MSVAFNSTGTRAYIGVDSRPSTVQIFDAVAYRMIDSVNVGNSPGEILVSQGDQLIFTANFDGRSISIIDPVTLTVQTNALPGRPRGLVFTQ